MKWANKLDDIGIVACPEKGENDNKFHPTLVPNLYLDALDALLN